MLYEEIAEYYYLFARAEKLEGRNVKAEVDYHIGNIVLLSLYFDTVLVQTAAIFNSTDPFVRKVAEGVVNHRTFRQMIDCNVVKVVGWGGNTPQEMFQAAKGFSIASNPAANDAEYLSVIASLFDPESTVSRSERRPDDEIATLFRKRLEQTTIIRREDDYANVEVALQKSLEKTGQLVAISFSPELGKLQLAPASSKAVGTSFIQSWYDHLEEELPGVSVYAPLTNPIFIDQKAKVDEKAIRTFLYSPQIFASFISGYLQPADFDKILRQPYRKLLKVRNGDWKRFSDAYHKAIHSVSQNIGHLNHAEISAGEFGNEDHWASSLEAYVKENADQVDINAFIESLAMIAGVVFSLPILAPISRAAGLLVGKRVNEVFYSLTGKATADISPFIEKLMRHYELAGIRA